MSAAWQRLLFGPSSLETDADHVVWFDAVASRLLCGCQLVAGGVAHRITEVEFYYRGGSHLDPFAHRDPVQVENGRWYFHRTGGVYRGGSFKGLDLTFGPPSAFGGILIRGLEQQDGPLFDGPSLCVDHLLRLNGVASVAALDAAIAGRSLWDDSSPLWLRWVDPPADRPILRTARVGLSLKRLRQSEGPARFLMRRYRYLTEPRRISKGKPHMVLALHADGKSPDEIRALTNATRAAIGRYLADFVEGRAEADFTRYFGLEIGPRDLARLHGLWHVEYGSEVRQAF